MIILSRLMLYNTKMIKCYITKIDFLLDAEYIKYMALI